MRKRSGGLHCQTEQQFIQLAQLSQQKCGLYYDDQLNRKRSDLTKAKNKQNKKTESEQKKVQKSKVFMDFDFNEVDIQEKEMLAQLLRFSNKYLSVNVTVICARPEFERVQLQKVLRENQTSNHFEEELNFGSNKQPQMSSFIKTKDTSQERLVDLYIHKIPNQLTEVPTTYKFWFVKINSINPQICTTYLNMNSQLFRISRDLDQQVNLAQLSNTQGKRHAIRDVKDCSQILHNIVNARDFQFGQRRPSDISLFSPKYQSNEEEFFHAWNNQRFLDRKR